MERIMKSQAYAKADDTQSKHYASQKKVLEINPRHPLIKKLLARVEESADETVTTSMAQVMCRYTVTTRTAFL